MPEESKLPTMQDVDYGDSIDDADESIAQLTNSASKKAGYFEVHRSFQEENLINGARKSAGFLDESRISN